MNRITFVARIRFIDFNINSDILIDNNDVRFIWVAEVSKVYANIT